MIERIPSGIPGLDQVLHGGIVKNSIVSVIGATGTGKSIAALQYVLRGLVRGEHVLYLSLEERPNKLIKEGLAIGLRQFSEYPDIQHMFHYVSGEHIVEFFNDVLPQMSTALERQIKVHTRVVIDPITPLLWEIGDQRSQRKMLVDAYDNLRRLGTVLQTVEDTSPIAGSPNGLEPASVPIYLSDMVVNFQNLHIGGPFSRTARVIKSRGTSHAEGLYPLSFVQGAGLVIQAPVTPIVDSKRMQPGGEAAEHIEAALRKAIRAPPTPELSSLIVQLETMKNRWDEDQGDPRKVLNVMLEEFGLA